MSFLRRRAISLATLVYKGSSVQRLRAKVPFSARAYFHSSLDSKNRQHAPTHCSRPFSNHSQVHAGGVDGKDYVVPDVADCKAMPRKYRSASNDVLSVLAAQGLFGARRERLLREIMAKDEISWPEARKKLYQINVYNDRYGWLFQLPYQMGIFLGVVGGFGCIPLVFHYDVAHWFNNVFVHEEDPGELHNFWQVGEWTWGWMEPVMGTLSFTLLSLQLSRQFMVKMELQPYQDHVNNFRANRLANKFPQYEREIVRDFAKSDSWVDTVDSSHRRMVEKEIEAGEKEDEMERRRQSAKAAHDGADSSADRR